MLVVVGVPPEWHRLRLIHEVVGKGGCGGGDDENRHEPHEASPDGAGVPRRYVQRPPCARTHTLLHKEINAHECVMHCYH